MNQKPCRMAVLIDGDSIEPALLGRALAEASRHGTVEIRRIYGGREKLDSWEACINNNGIDPVPNDAGYKNAADVMLIIDAANMLHRRNGIDGFCIVTSDNDFAGLARWMREQGAFVAGIGSSKNTPPLDFKSECDCFMYAEELPPSDNPDPAAQRKLSGWKEAVKEAVRMSARKDEWAMLSDVGNKLRETGPAINYRDYCHRDLLPLIKSCPEFEVELDRVRLRGTKIG